MAVPVFWSSKIDPHSSEPLRLNAEVVSTWLVQFLRDECIRRRGITQAVLGLSGGIDSAVTAYLCAQAFGPDNVVAVRIPYKTSSPDSLTHAQLVIDHLGLQALTVDITGMVDGYADWEALTPRRLGNVCARARMIVLFDLSAKLGALPIGTGNKTERMFGYFTWHADDSPPINPLGDLFKTQVRQLAEHLQVPEPIRKKLPTADLEPDQTDEGDLGITYEEADRILHYRMKGFPARLLVEAGFEERKVTQVDRWVDATHWKRRPPTVAMLSSSSIGDYYLRPVDY
ncbi:MAG: NAD(+) synthase [Fimbriimonadaceae bacterium]|nr:MAG: NAD(+) synthase [Fimbriimonadaceae bacterium]